MNSHIKKDKDHDVLGYSINPRKLDIPDEEINKIIIDLGGKKFIWIPDKGNLQCAKCLYQMQLLVYPDDGKPVRKFYTLDSCACNRQE